MAQPRGPSLLPVPRKLVTKASLPRLSSLPVTKPGGSARGPAPGPRRRGGRRSRPGRQRLCQGPGEQGRTRSRPVSSPRRDPPGCRTDDGVRRTAESFGALAALEGRPAASAELARVAEVRTSTWAFVRRLVGGNCSNNISGTELRAVPARVHRLAEVLSSRLPGPALHSRSRSRGGLRARRRSRCLRRWQALGP